MKYQFPIYALIGLATASAQSLYDTSSGSSAFEDSTPFAIVGSLSYGYDDNVNPIGSDIAGVNEEGSSFIEANIGATYTETRSNAYLGFSANVGAIYYFDDINDIDGVTPVFDFGLNLGYDVNSRIKLTSNNHVTYGLEPDFERGIAADRRQDEYFAYSSFNTIGIRWTERFGTRHSVGISGTDFGNGRDFNRITFRNELRYRLNNRTILKAGHNTAFNDTTSTTSNSYFGGIEHSFSERAGFDIEVGGSSVGDDSGLYVNSNLRYAVSDRLNLTAYFRFNTDDILVNNLPTGNSVPTDLADFESRDSLSTGLRANYNVNRSLVLHGGFDIQNIDYNDRSDSGFGPIAQGGDFDTTLYHINAGLSYSFSEKLSAVFNYNYTTSEADDSIFFEYDRNRYSVGLTYRF